MDFSWHAQIITTDAFLALRTPKAGPKSRSDPRDHILLRVRGGVCVCGRMHVWGVC